MDNALRNWKCRNCGRANKTAVALDGTAKCEFCTYVMSVQPSRINKGGAVQPASYPTKAPTPGSGTYTDR